MVAEKAVLVARDDGVRLDDGRRNDEGGRLGRFLELAKGLLQLDVPGETEGAQDGDAVPVHIKFIPGEAVTRGLRCEMMIVVPAFAEGEHGHPEAVGGCIASIEAL